MPLKRDEAFWKEGMDEKRFALCCIHKIWICLAAALASAVFAAGIYLGVRQLTMGPKQYRSEVLYSIVYDIDEDDEVLKEFINEYNAYTWGDMMRSDRVMDSVLLQLPDALLPLGVLFDGMFQIGTVHRRIHVDFQFLGKPLTAGVGLLPVQLRLCTSLFLCFPLYL